MKKILYLFLTISLIFAGCKKEDDPVAPSSTFTKVYGCTDEGAVNFNSSANVYVPNICCYSTGCEMGCTDETAVNYNFQATEDDGSCIYPAAASWDCVPGEGCYDFGTGNGQYNSLSACENDCEVVTESWDCSSGLGCSDPGTGNGQYNSLSACQNDCGSASGYEIFVSVTEGNYPEEISWEIYDPSGSGTTIYAGGAPFSQVVCIPSVNMGSLEFRMYDSALDGWDGSQYTLSTFNGTIAAGTLDNGDYSSDTFNFTGGEPCNK
jgi:hypothetical protein